MIVLQEDPGEWAPQHLAFTVDARDIERAATLLAEQGIAVPGPGFHAWMPAQSVYFVGPDGHQLELCAPMPTP
jgi:catechol 2,3-dioxygenase-like lactoylglutathione lyase family enzyme